MVRETLTITLEKGDDELWGSIDAPGFLLTSVGASVEEVTTNLRDLVADFLENEGKDMPEWKGIKETDITYNYEYDLTALFDVFKAIKITTIAEFAGINSSLMRQYAIGNKKPSEKQAKKIETALRQLGERLMHVSVA
ncbi:hypothetical protein [Fibrella aquatica]|uniref:hypothetical protein n=1 Tax=Fibrella aquatica TaxID=3242487 RepID=UPI003522BE13